MSQPEKHYDFLEDIVKKAKSRGADAAEALIFEGNDLSLSYRLGKPESLERSESQDMGLRVFIGKQQAVVSSSDLSLGAVDEMIDRALSMAKVVPEDPYCGLADPDQVTSNRAEIDSFDPSVPSEDQLINWAATAEENALGVDGITNSEGGNAGWFAGGAAIFASNGFKNHSQSSRSYMSVSVLAGEGTQMERDYEYDYKVYLEDLEDPAAIGKKAAENTLKRLHPRKVETAKVPVVYSPRVAQSLLGHLSGAISGSAISRGTSFLKDALGEQVFSKCINIVDDPHMKRGLASSPNDSEGLAHTKMNFVEDGVLQSWFMDLSSARQLGLESTGHASHRPGGKPSPSLTNFYLEAGAVTPSELIEDIKSGFYVTELIGMGVNGVTGDYSRGASGFWIENGEIVYPVSELTIAGNLKEMFLNLTAANDLTFKYGKNAPSVRIEGLTVAGQTG